MSKSCHNKTCSPKLKSIFRKIKPIFFISHSYWKLNFGDLGSFIPKSNQESITVDELFGQKSILFVLAKMGSTSEVILLDRSVVKVEGRAET